MNELLPDGSHKLKVIEKKIAFFSERGLTFPEDYYTYSGDMCVETEKDSPFLDYLRSFFNREKIVNLHTYCDERNKNMSIIEKSMIRMHVNHFGNFAKVIDFNTNDNNLTIGFWLFEDCLVYTDQSGKSSW